MMTHRIRGQGLIEMLMILLFIGVSIAAILKFQGYLAYSTQLAQQQSEANLLAISQIEQLRNFTVLNTTAGYSAYQDIAPSSTTSIVNNTTYTINWTITAFTNPTYKKINVTVSWTDRYATAQSVSLSTSAAGIDPSAPGTYM